MKEKLLWIDREQKLQGKNYIGMFDLVKGLAMIGIIFFHCLNHYLDYTTYDGGENAWIRLLLSPLTILRYGYAPLLFMICGYGIRKQPVKKSISTNLKMFFLPYMIVTVGVLLCVLVKQLVNGGNILRRLWVDVLPFFLGFRPGWHRVGSFMGNIGPLWFFWAYIFGSIFLNIILQEKRQWVQIITLAISSLIAVDMRDAILPFCLQQVVICSGFMYVGIHMKKSKMIHKPIPAYVGILTYNLCVFCTVRGGISEISNNIYQLGAQDLAASYIAGVVLLCVLQRIDVLQGRLPNAIRWIGRHMLPMCCFHTITYLMVPWNKVSLWFVDMKFLGVFIEFVFSFVFAVAACVIMEMITRMLLKNINKKGDTVYEKSI